jgi:hypothetical protein
MIKMSINIKDLTPEQRKKMGLLDKLKDAGIDDKGNRSVSSPPPGSSHKHMDVKKYMGRIKDVNTARRGMDVADRLEIVANMYSGEYGEFTSKERRYITSKKSGENMWEAVEQVRMEKRKRDDMKRSEEENYRRRNVRSALMQGLMGGWANQSGSSHSAMMDGLMGGWARSAPTSHKNKKAAYNNFDHLINLGGPVNKSRGNQPNFGAYDNIGGFGMMSFKDPFAKKSNKKRRR